MCSFAQGEIWGRKGDGREGVSLGRASKSPDEAVSPFPPSLALSLVASGVFCPEAVCRAGRPSEQMLPLVLGRCRETCKCNLGFQKSSECFIHFWQQHWVGSKALSLLNISC